MKKVACILIMVLSAFICNAEGVWTTGDEMRFSIPKNDRAQSFFLERYDDVDNNWYSYVLTLLLRDACNYYKFPDNSKLLLKLSNDSIIELDSFGDTKTNCISGILMGVHMYTYETYRHFILNDSDLQNILNFPIIKIRIELSNGDRKDIELEAGESKKLIKKINKSLPKIKEKQKERIRNVENDLKDDF